MPWVRSNKKGSGGGSILTELYSFDQSQGGVWINSNIDVTNLNALLFIFNSGTDDFKMRQIPKSDIAIYTGGADVYTTIFPSEFIWKQLNVRIYNNILWISFNDTGSASNVAKVYNPIL